MRKDKGFTFVELLVVVTILGVLAGVGMVSFRSTNKNARDAKRKADIEQIRSGLEICRSESGTYPASIDTTITCGGTVYLSPVPLDPRDGQSGYSYTYTPGAGNLTYTMCATTMEGDSETSPYCVTNP